MHVPILLSSNKYICGWCVGHEGVACGTGVEDGPLFDGFGVDINRLEKDRSCKGVIVGGDQTRRSKFNITIYFSSSIVACPYLSEGMRLRVRRVDEHHHCARRWCRCGRSRLGKLRRRRSKLLPHVMHLVVGCGRHHLRHRGGEVDWGWRLLPSCKGRRTLLAQVVG